ncbi:MAG: DJ-1/PfpI family protein [Oscillospiraceae bacterium]
MIYVFFANGTEEIEALTPVDLLRRCELDVKTVGIGSNIVRSSHGIPVVTDLTAEEIVLDDALEMIVLPGGMPGTLNLEKNPDVQRAIDFCAEKGIFIAAICAAPSILGHKGLLRGRRATCFPGFEGSLEGAQVTNALVETDGKFVTGKGAGAAMTFSLRLAALLTSQARADLLEASLQCK